MQNQYYKVSDFTSSHFDTKFEQVQTKYDKFILNISKLASNHAIRAELGKFPLHIQTDIKLIKYWHRLENLTDNSILMEAYMLCQKISFVGIQILLGLELLLFFSKNG